MKPFLNVFPIFFSSVMKVARTGRGIADFSLLDDLLSGRSFLQQR